VFFATPAALRTGAIAGARGIAAAATSVLTEIRRLLSDVYELKAGKPGMSPEFFGFQNWPEVVEFANSEEGEALRTFVQLVGQHGEAKLWAAVKKAVADESEADAVLSRWGAWVKPFASFKKGVRPAYTWEPVIQAVPQDAGRLPPAWSYRAIGSPARSRCAGASPAQSRQRSAIGLSRSSAR
jgi:hypothetical protein